MGGVTDEEVYNYANKNNMVLVTRDLGFGDMYMVRGGYGLILVRLPYFFTAHQINKVLNTFLREVKPQEVRRSIIVRKLLGHLKFFVQYFIDLL